MKTILPFLQALKANNNREWFVAHKSDYEKSKEELSVFVDLLLKSLAKEESALIDLTSKDCLFRIYRDVRFSKNKDPYKTNMGAVIAPEGRKSVQACYYLHIDPDACFLAGGIYMPESNKLKLIRQEIDYNLAGFETILHQEEFKSTFGTLDENGRLKTRPKGYDAENPAMEYLKNKSFTVSYSFDSSEVNSPEFLQKCLGVFRKIRPLNTFLNNAIDN